jgi:hypothetical protein
VRSGRHWKTMPGLPARLLTLVYKRILRIRKR